MIDKDKCNEKTLFYTYVKMVEDKLYTPEFIIGQLLYKAKCSSDYIIAFSLGKEFGIKNDIFDKFESSGLSPINFY